MKLCRFQTSQAETRIGLLTDENKVLDLSSEGLDRLSSLWEIEDWPTLLTSWAQRRRSWFSLDQVRLLPPVEQQEVWAAGVTYLRSKKARMQESDFSATAYDRVYDAARPELFFKSLAHKAVGPGEAVGIRRDSKWNVPEPELALVFSPQGRLIGYTIGNDMSSRDIEGENLLYLPQAKIYKCSCALGPCIRVGVDEAEARTWTVSLLIQRSGLSVFEGQTSVANIKRSFKELAEYLFRCQQFPHGAILLTGTGIIPPNDFSLQPGDAIRMEISGIGTLENTVIEV